MVVLPSALCLCSHFPLWGAHCEIPGILPLAPFPAPGKHMYPCVCMCAFHCNRWQVNCCLSYMCGFVFPTVALIWHSAVPTHACFPIHIQVTPCDRAIPFSSLLAVKLLKSKSVTSGSGSICCIALFFLLDDQSSRILVLINFVFW